MLVGSIPRPGLGPARAVSGERAGALGGRFRARWIISREADALWLSGGTLLGLVLLVWYAAFGLDLPVVWFGWLILLNGPHVFATYTRTYLAPSERRAHRRLLRSSLGLFLVGPAVLLCCGLLARAGFTWHRAPLLGYLVFVGVWAYWHTVRQDHGILRLYQRKNREERADYWVDLLFVHVGLLAPFVLLLARHPDVGRQLGMALPAPAMAVLRAACTAAIVLVAALFFGRQAVRWSKGLPLSVPKLLFALTVVPFYVFMGTSDLTLGVPLFALVPLLIIPHDLQYHAMVWLYHRNQAAAGHSHRQPPDAGGRPFRRIPVHAASAVALGALLATLSCAIDRDLGCPEVFYSTTQLLLPGITVRDLLVVTFHGFFIHHYFIDQYIWKPGRDPRAAVGLGLRAEA